MGCLQHCLRLQSPHAHSPKALPAVQAYSLQAVKSSHVTILRRSQGDLRDTLCAAGQNVRQRCSRSLPLSLGRTLQLHPDAKLLYGLWHCHELQNFHLMQQI